jgi:hypothetical protein
VHSPPLITISTSLYKAISTLQKTMFVESHGYPQGLKPKERDVAAAVLVEKRAYIHPPDTPIVPAAGAAAGSPLAQSPKRAARSGGWGSTTLGEELAPSMFKSPAKLPMSETRAARSGRKSSEGAMTTPQEGAFSLPPLPFDLAEYFPDFGARGRWAHRHFERYMYALDLLVEHRVFRYPSYKSHAEKAWSARFKDDEGNPVAMSVLCPADWHMLESLMRAIQLRVLRSALFRSRDRKSRKERPGVESKESEARSQKGQGSS